MTPGTVQLMRRTPKPLHYQGVARINSGIKVKILQNLLSLIHLCSFQVPNVKSAKLIESGQSVTFLESATVPLGVLGLGLT